MVAMWINRLNESNSRLHKEAVLKDALSAVSTRKSAEYFIKALNMCYNSYITYGVKQVQDVVDDPTCISKGPWESFFALLNDLSNRVYTGNAAKAKLEEISQEFSSDDWNLVCAPIIRRDLRVGVSTTTINKIFKNTGYEIPVFSCQLASVCEGRPEMSGIKRLEPKLDGVRVLVQVKNNNGRVSTACFSRNGKVFENFTEIENQISNHASEISRLAKMNTNFFLDGEVTGESFQSLMKQARRKERVEANDSVFHIFDIIDADAFSRGVYKVSLGERIAKLEALQPIIDQSDNLELLTSILVNLDTLDGQVILKNYSNDMVVAGYEGIMIKDLDAPYKCTRSTSWMKWKPVHDYDLTVIGVEPGTGKHEGRMGALVCEGVDDGKHIVVNAGSGYTDEQRQDYWDNRDYVIGQTAVIRADAITLNQNGTYSLRFPRFVTFREDK